MNKDEIKKFVDQLSSEELNLYARRFIEEDASGKKLVNYINHQLSKDRLHNAEVSVEQPLDKVVNHGERKRKRKRSLWSTKDKIKLALIFLGPIAFVPLLRLILGYEMFEEIVTSISIFGIFGFWIFMILARK